MPKTIDRKVSKELTVECQNAGKIEKNYSPDENQELHFESVEVHPLFGNRQHSTLSGPDRPVDPCGGSWIPNCNLIVRLLDRDSMQINLEYVLNLINPSGFISTVFSILSDAALTDHQFLKISEPNTALESDQWWSNPEKMTLLTEFGCKFPHIFLVSSITIALTVNFASPKFIAFTRVLIKYIYTGWPMIHRLWMIFYEL